MMARTRAHRSCAARRTAGGVGSSRPSIAVPDERVLSVGSVIAHVRADRTAKLSPGGPEPVRLSFGGGVILDQQQPQPVEIGV